MSRRVITMQTESLEKADRVDTYIDKVIKYIPADIVAAWVAVTGIVKGAGEGVNPVITLWIAFMAGVAITFVWTWKQTSKEGLPPVWKQIIISTFAFVVWVIALGGPPFEINTTIGAILLIGFTLIAALSEP
jgi:hypothetical protein